MSSRVRAGHRVLWSTQRVTLAFGLAVAVSLSVCTEAPAMTLKLVFPDGQPMTHGSACSGEACLLRGTGIQTTNASGEIVLADAPDRVVEYRRDAIAWWEVPLGVAAGRLSAVGERATVVLPRMLLDTAPAVDAVELDIVALINAERAARGLALAVLNTRLSAAADLQATWLSSTAGLLQLPVLSHIGPFGSTLAFRLGEVSFPEPTGGAEIAAAGWTPAEAVANWMASAPHRDQVLAPGALLIGVAKVGSVIIVTTHPPCAGCDSAALAGGGPGALGPGDGAGPGAAGSPGTSATSGSGDRGGSSCGAERLRVQRLRARGGRLRLRVAMGCLRSSGRYTLSVIQRPSRSLLTRRKVKGPGAITVALRPSRNTRTLAIKLKRNGRVVATRTINRGAPRRAVPRAPARPGTSVSGERGGLSCTTERLRVQRLRARGGRLRLRVAMGCLRSSARYTLSVIQRPSRSLLTRRKIKGPGAITLALRPSRNTRTLAIKLKRNGRVVATRTINRGAPPRAVPRAPARPGTSVSGERGGLSCAKERLRVQRLRARGGRLRLRVAMGCLRSSARYTLSVIQRPSRSVLTRRKIKGPGAITLALRPSRNTRALGIKLKRNGRVVATRTINRRAADRLAR